MDENKTQNNNPSKNIKTIHTYTSDMADAVRENEVSVIKIALAEKEKREREAIYEEASGTKSSKILLTLGGLVLVGLAIFGWYYLSKKNQEANTPKQIIKEMEAIISYDEKAYLDLTDKKNQSDLSTSLKEEVARVGKPGSIKSIFLTEKRDGVQQLFPLKDLISAMNTQIPASLIRALDDQYMAGTYTKEDVSHLFLIFKVKDYNQAYASMLTWEKTMLRDLFTIFNIDLSENSEFLFEKAWGDVIIDNKDARIIYDRSGKQILYYAFPNKNHFIITDDQDTIREVNLRLLSKTTKPL